MMIRKVWQLRSVFLLIGLAVAFAACVKKEDPNKERDEIKARLTEITEVIAQKNLGDLNGFFIQPVATGKGPNALLAEVQPKIDSLFVMRKRRVSIDRKRATVRFTFTNDPSDSAFSYLYLRKNGSWKISGFEIN